MGLLGRLFSRKQNQPAQPQEEEIFFDSPYGRFYYLNSPQSNEFGYEATVKHEDPNSVTGEGEMTLYFETDTPDTTDAFLCFARLEQMYAEKERISFEIKKMTADFFLMKPGFFKEGSTEQELIDGMEIFWVGFFRNGDTEFSVDTRGIYASEIAVYLRADGTKEIKYFDYDRQLHTERL